MTLLKIPVWLIAICAFIFIGIILEQLYVSKRPVEIFGIKLNQPKNVKPPLSSSDIIQYLENDSVQRYMRSKISKYLIDNRLRGSIKRQIIQYLREDIMVRKQLFPDGLVILKIQGGELKIPESKCPEGSIELGKASMISDPGAKANYKKYFVLGTKLHRGWRTFEPVMCIFDYEE